MLPVLYTFSVVVSLTTVRWAPGPVVRRPREETGAGPAALSGPVRYPDRKQLEAAAAAAEHKMWRAASSGRATRKPGLIYGWMRAAVARGRRNECSYIQCEADVLLRSVRAHLDVFDAATQTQHAQKQRIWSGE